MTPEQNKAEWIRIAEMALSSSHHLFDNHRPKPLEIICFHTQQSAEKMLKCFLVVHNVEIPKTHDLNVLWNMCLEIDERSENIFSSLNLLNRYSVIPRYPNELHIEEHETEKALENADFVMDFVKSILSQHELKTNSEESEESEASE